MLRIYDRFSAGWLRASTIFLIAAGCAQHGRSGQPISMVPPRAGLAFANATVVDVRTGQLYPRFTVIVTGNRIATAGPASAVRIPAGARVINASGKYLIPGLTDTHVHLFAADWVSAPVDTVAYFGWILAGGVTSIREMSTDGFEYLPLRAAIDAGRLLAPRLYLSAGPNRRSPDPWSKLFERLGTRDIASAIRHFRAFGVDGLKLSHSAPRDTMVSIVALARAAGAPVYGHTVLRGPDGRFDNFTMDLVRAGLDGVVHSSGTLRPPGIDDRPPPSVRRTTAEGREAWQIYDHSAWQRARDGDIQALIDTMVARRVWYEPTRLVTYYWWNLAEYERRGLSGYHRWATDPSEQATGSLRHAELGAEAAEARFIRRFHDAGGILLAGSDEVPFPPYGVSEEMRLLVKAGLPSLAALQAATINAARAMRWEDRLGTVEVGKLADIVLLDGNPLEDIANVRRIHAVVTNGRLLDRAMLDEMLTRVGTPTGKGE